MEAGLGAIWGEDPRYFRDAGAPFKNRLAHVFKMTFLARNRDGNLMPAYARFIAIPSSSALASTWRPESERSMGNVGARIGLGVVGRMGTDAFTEFWPDVRRLILRRKPPQASFRDAQTKKAPTSELPGRADALKVAVFVQNPERVFLVARARGKGAARA